MDDSQVIYIIWYRQVQSSKVRMAKKWIEATIKIGFWPNLVAPRVRVDLWGSTQQLDFWLMTKTCLRTILTIEIRRSPLRSPWIRIFLTNKQVLKKKNHLQLSPSNHEASHRTSVGGNLNEAAAVVTTCFSQRLNAEMEELNKAWWI